MTQCVISEELARGDAGVSQVILINVGMIVQPAVMSDNNTVLERFCPPFCQGKLAYACISMTDQPDDCDTENPLLHCSGIKTTAAFEGDEWVVNGAKIWPANGGLVDIYPALSPFPKTPRMKSVSGISKKRNSGWADSKLAVTWLPSVIMT